MIAWEKRILAQPGDVFGVHYSGASNTGPIPYETSDRALCCGLSSGDLSRIHNNGKRDSQLPVGTVVNVDLATLKRLPALKPILGGKISQRTVHI